MNRSPYGFAYKLVLLLIVTGGVSCGSADPERSPDRPSAVVGDGETVIRGDETTGFDGVELRVPAGALESGTEIEIVSREDETPLPPGAHAVGPQFAVLPEALRPSEPIEMMVPFEPDQVAEFEQTPVMVKVWLRRPDLENDWELLEQLDSTAETVTVELSRGGTLGAGVKVDQD